MDDLLIAIAPGGECTGALVDECTGPLVDEAGAKREYGADTIVSGGAEEGFFRLLCTWFFFSPLPDGIPLIASEVMLI